MYCTGLTSVTVGNSVTNIGTGAFYCCTSLRGVYFLGNTPSLGANEFTFDNTAIVYYLPGTTGWGSTFGGLLTTPWSGQLSYGPVFGFAIFYNSLLEFTWCAPMTINGRTHANGSIYTGSISQLTFNSLVTTTGTISSPAWDGHPTSAYTVATTYNAGYSTNVQPLTLSIGTGNVHAIIDIPPNGEDPNSALGQQRYYNKAELVLLVSNATVTLTIKTSSADPQPTNTIASYSNHHQLRPGQHQFPLPHPYQYRSPISGKVTRSR